MVRISILVALSMGLMSNKSTAMGRVFQRVVPVVRLARVVKTQVGREAVHSLLPRPEQIACRPGIQCDLLALRGRLAGDVEELDKKIKTLRLEAAALECARDHAVGLLADMQLTDQLRKFPTLHTLRREARQEADSVAALILQGELKKVGMLAAGEGKKDLARYTFSSFQLSPVHLAVVSGNYDMVALLCSIFTTHFRDAAGLTPLHYAVRLGDVESARRLIWAGYSTDEQDNEGITPLRLASSMRNAEMENLLMEMQAACAVQSTGC